MKSSLLESDYLLKAFLLANAMFPANGTPFFFNICTLSGVMLGLGYPKSISTIEELSKEVTSSDSMSKFYNLRSL